MSNPTSVRPVTYEIRTSTGLVLAYSRESWSVVKRRAQAFADERGDDVDIFSDDNDDALMRREETVFAR